MKRYIKASTINILDKVKPDDKEYCFRRFKLNNYVSEEWAKRNLNPDKYTKADCESGFKFNPNIKDPYKRFWTQVELLEFLSACIKYRVPFNPIEAMHFLDDFKDGGGSLEWLGVFLYIEVTENGLKVVYDVGKNALEYNKDKTVIYTAQEIRDFVVSTFKKILRKLDDKLGLFLIRCSVTADFKWNSATNKEDFSMDVGPLRTQGSLEIDHLENGKWKIVYSPDRVGKIYDPVDLSWYGLEDYLDKY